MAEHNTIADIIAWLRRPREGENAYLTLWRNEIADRFEAAHKREAAFHAMTCEANERLREHLQIALDADKRERGDRAMLREALFASRDFIDRVLMFLHGMETTFPGEYEIIDKIRSALGEAPKMATDPRSHIFKI